ncbi:hypothetical protein BKA70DRAFT_1427627 [Coprinopsis sp. MPI-PUGE-AT-0042]|nr:hypothetical protein BKA70DRAFT_1427627 [Coprinopsis sp. MPI-PUGE-AT-0042]
MAPTNSHKVNRSRAVASAFAVHETKHKIQAKLVAVSPNQSPTPRGTKRPRLEPLTATKNAETGEGNWPPDEHPSQPLFELPKDNPIVANSNYDYMHQWAPKINDHLEVLYASETHSSTSRCFGCGGDDAIWKCTSCFASPMWTGDYFEDSWLWKLGVVIYTGHSGKCCPSVPPTPVHPLSAKDFQKAAQSSSTNHNDFSYGASSFSGKEDCSTEVVVVHINGVHHLPLVACQCPSEGLEHGDRTRGDGLVLDLLKVGLFPSSFKEPKTLFTFELLDEFLLQTLECNTSALHFYSMLQRKTNMDFPHVVPDRYRELLRVSRQYDFLRLMMRFVYFQKEQATDEGSLALFCAACPQPGKNLPPDWTNDPESWKYLMSFVVDGNFLCAHLKAKGAGQDMFLKMGQGYFAGYERYMAHVGSKAKDTEPKSKCNEFRAVADKNKFHKGYDATGIAAFACARHGCIVPSSVVDFQKGEKQLNIDYGLCQTIKMVVAPEIKQIFLLYDIACHYCVNLLDRIEKGEYLAIPELLQIIFGIGQFHVHGHQEKCFARFSPMFIPGLGTVAGEILESDWSIINPIGLLCVAMTQARRMEVLDNKMLDLNWKKMTNLVKSLVKLHEKAEKESKSSEEALLLLSNAVSRLDRAGWEKELVHAQAARAQGNISAMDVLEASTQNVPSRKDIQADLMEEEDVQRVGLGVSSWLAEGIAIQEAQIALMAVVAICRKSPTDAKKLEERKWRQMLVHRITEHVSQAAILFPRLAQAATSFVKAPVREPCRCEEGAICGHLGMDVNPFSDVPSAEDGQLEIPLPSSASHPSAFDPEMRRKELRLRTAQADEALAGLRQEIGLKTFLFKANKRLATTKSDRVRGFSGITAANREIDRYVRIYNQARWAIRRLSGSPRLLEQYRPLQKEDLKPLKAVYSANSTGATTSAISWIWAASPGSATPSESPYMNEIARNNFLRALCRRDRWQEELKLVKSEMDWSIRFFDWSASDVLNRISPSSPPGVSEAVARKQSLWMKMALQAWTVFQKYIT